MGECKPVIGTEIVSSENRSILDMGEWGYVYIPMIQREVDFFAPNIINPCWRIYYKRDKSVECLNCSWRGEESEVISVQYYPEDGHMIPGEMVEVCPECKSLAWEPID